MAIYCVRCDILPGKEEELDRFLTQRAKNFWLSQKGVKEFHVYSDALVGYPERTIMIEMEDLTGLQDILQSGERKRLRSEFLNYTTNVQSQIMDRMV